MASDETMTVISCMQDEEFDDTDDGSDHHNHPHNLSRLSMCTSSMYTNEVDGDDDDDGDVGMNIFMSRLSIESFDGDADDEELSDEKEFKGLAELSSDSDKEPGCYSLPATPPRRRARRGSMSQQYLMGVKDYASENEAEKGMLIRQKMRRNLRKRRIMNNNNNNNSKKNFNNNNNKKDGSNSCFSGESDQSGGGCGLVVITRPKGGSRSLCMGLGEMKACRDLGFELEHERTLELPSSSGGNSPISNWRISSPGDDPRDVKARLKVWAQAVALASTSRYTT